MHEELEAGDLSLRSARLRLVEPSVVTPAPASLWAKRTFQGMPGGGLNGDSHGLQNTWRLRSHF